MLPELGGRKLKELLEEKHQITVGRDRLFEVLRQNDLLVPVKRSYVRTTASAHGLRVFANRLARMKLTGAHQAWVSDLTYIATREGFRYLALITDAYSRKIVGFDLSASLSIEGCLRALSMAIEQLPALGPGEQRQTLHHGDRGVQYCSHAYQRKLRQHGIGVSMADVGNPYQNAIAERVNGILKYEFHLRETFASEREAARAVEQAVRIYNTRRPHLALRYRTPEDIHRGATTTRSAAA